MKKKINFRKGTVVMIYHPKDKKDNKYNGMIGLISSNVRYRGGWWVDISEDKFDSILVSEEEIRALDYIVSPRSLTSTFLEKEIDKLLRMDMRLRPYLKGV